MLGHGLDQHREGERDRDFRSVLSRSAQFGTWEAKKWASSSSRFGIRSCHCSTGERTLRASARRLRVERGRPGSPGSVTAVLLALGLAFVVYVAMWIAEWMTRMSMRKAFQRPGRKRKRSPRRL